MKTKNLLAVALVGTLAFTNAPAQQVPLPKTAAEVPGPAAGNTMTREYVQSVGRMACVWGYGYARRVMPKSRWGSPELVGRFSHEDLDDGTVQGGKFNKTYLGLNWWATRRWKLGFGWGHTWLDRFGRTGVTDSFQTRLQWIY